MGLIVLLSVQQQTGRAKTAINRADRLTGNPAGNNWPWWSTPPPPNPLALWKCTPKKKSLLKWDFYSFSTEMRKIYWPADNVHMYDNVGSARPKSLKERQVSGKSSAIRQTLIASQHIVGAVGNTQMLTGFNCIWATAWCCHLMGGVTNCLSVLSSKYVSCSFSGQSFWSRICWNYIAWNGRGEGGAKWYNLRWGGGAVARLLFVLKETHDPDKLAPGLGSIAAPRINEFKEGSGVVSPMHFWQVASKDAIPFWLFHPSPLPASQDTLCYKT